MGFRFNEGTPKEIVMTRVVQGYSVYDETLGTSYRTWYYAENRAPYDLMPIIRLHLSDSTSYEYFFRNNTPYRYGFKIVVTTTTITVEWGYMYVNTWTKYNQIAQLDRNNLPNSLIVYFLWDNPGSEYLSIGIMCGTRKFWACQVKQISTQYPAGYICGTRSEEEYEATAFNTYSYVPPLNANRNELYRIPDFVANGPMQQVVIINVAPYGQDDLRATGNQGQPDVLIGIDGEEPEPYDPPAPPTPPGPSDDPNDEGDPAGPDGGDGDHDPTYDPVPVPDKPSDGVADAGFITLYRMTFREFDEFASKCFADTVWEAIKQKFNNPTDFLVGALLLPFIPDVGLSFYPKFGIKTLDTAYDRIDNQFYDLNCGDVTISKYWGSCFDYEPFTKIQIWLPYIGYKDLPVDEFMDMTINVKYRIDCLTGDCIAFVSTGVVGELGPQIQRVIGQYYGNCGVRVPFGSNSYDSAIAAGITLIGAAAASGLGAAFGAAASGLESGGGVLMSAGAAAGATVTGPVGRAASIGAVQGMKPNVQHGGAAGASAGYMGVQTPYLIRRIPRQNLPDGFMNLKGYPSNIGGKLADFSGLAIVDEIQLNDIPAMEGERQEIIEWLRGGVLI